MQVVPDTMVEEVTRRFALLGDPTRLRIVRVLHEFGGSTVGEIATAAGTSAANASQHLGRLLLGGVAGRTRDGQTVRYRITDDTVGQLCRIVCDSVAGRAIASGGPGTR
jgi:DNA-binding transcriptional ArsR family regulator